ncbi:YncE family protein [Dysgonomonas reticulitermitis]
MKKIKFSFLPLIVALSIMTGISSCRGDDDEIIPPDETEVTPGETSPVKGFYLLNEANMGSNKSSIDYFDYESGTYFKNIFPIINPTVVKELGDVGNDIQIYGNKLYAVINVSGYVEVMNKMTGKHENEIIVKNCRYIVFDKGYAYISSYDADVKITPDAPIGCVVKVDTATMKEVGRCIVGYQPEEMVIRDNKLYVANSGGYRVPDYDNTVSVIDLNTFTESKKITVAINLHRMELDSDGNIYVSSRGDYKYVSSNTYIIGKNDMIVKTLDLPCGNMTASGDSIYMYSVEWSHITQSNTVSYTIVNTKTRNVVSRNFITDGTDKRIKVPYGLAINPETKEIFVTDAKDYVTSGTLYCFTPQGKKKWEVITGDIPAHIVFTRNRMENSTILREN